MVLHASSGASQGMILDIYRQIKSTGEFSQKAFWQVSETLQEVGLRECHSFLPLLAHISAHAL